MRSPTELRADIEQDLTGYDRETLEWNYRQLGTHALAWIEYQDEQHRQYCAQLRDGRGLALSLLDEVLRLRRAGRKQARLDDLLGAARERQAANDGGDQ